MSQSKHYLDYILKIGFVTSVDGRSVDVCVDKSKNASHLLYNGALLKNVSVGSYIKISKGFEELIGKIEGERIAEDKTTNKQYSNNKERIKRYLKIKLIGYIESSEFKQGIKELPLLDNECYLLTATEFNQVHKFVNDKEKEHVIKLGALASEIGVSIDLGVNRLFASHIGIFGNTGSGKSYTLSKLYHELFHKYQNNTKFKENTQFVLIDFNGEYVNPKISGGIEDCPDIIIEKEFKEEYVLPQRKFPISKETIENVEILSILLDATEKTQKPFLDRVVKNSKFNEDNFCPKQYLKDELINVIIKKRSNNLGKKIFIDLFNDLYEVINNPEISRNIKTILDNNLNYNPSSEGYYIPKEIINETKDVYFDRGPKEMETYFNKPLNDLIDKIDFKSNDLDIVKVKIIFNYYKEVINEYSNMEFISYILKRVKKVFNQLNEFIEIKEHKYDEEKFLTVISLKNINDTSIKKALSLVISKQYYDAHKTISDKTKYLNIIIDEAHNVLSKSSNRESETWKDYRLETFEEIIKEGRKFGVFLTIASQRPSDISDTIISQLHNYFLHRLINNKDIDAIEKTVSYLDKVSFDNIPILPQGTCILAGLSAQIPVVIKVDEIPDENENGEKVRYAPFNETINLTNNWIDS